jgi:hypothetical protein
MSAEDRNMVEKLYSLHKIHLIKLLAEVFL